MLIGSENNTVAVPETANKREKSGSYDCGGTFHMDGSHAGGPRKGGERRSLVQPLIDKGVPANDPSCCLACSKKRKQPAVPGRTRKALEKFEQRLEENIAGLEEELRTGI